ncbi:hypothetical protein GH5_02963 [Leishmania sp. Ghana 2012 LV757]|uniref:hypothetical protein n=1 Tax=Leishmania sp. Ghana 2012 LV757 TaxID=2803181 RepID=UPI001B482570|nr:hypothetical protein GH5_02963 [Leishmania sp. Ghana 2012 LV757]
MLSVTRFVCCVAAAAGKKYSFTARMQRLQADPEHPLSGPEYAFMRDRLAEYRKLQQKYAVKQTEVERARKAANMCGLEFTGKGGGKAPSS